AGGRAKAAVGGHRKGRSARAVGRRASAGEAGRNRSRRATESGLVEPLRPVGGAAWFPQQGGAGNGGSVAVAASAVGPADGPTRPGWPRAEYQLGGVPAAHR